MKLKVNKDRCISCGMCVSICESVFDFDDDGKAKVIVNEIPEDDLENAEAAKDGCPGEAIEEVK